MQLIATIILATTLLMRASGPAENPTVQLSRMTAEHSRSKLLVRVDAVVFAGDYAATEWHNPYVGGMMIFLRHNEKWQFVGSGGGMMNANDMVQLYHVPAPVDETLTKQIREHDERQR